MATIIQGENFRNSHAYRHLELCASAPVEKKDTVFNYIEGQNYQALSTAIYLSAMD